MVYFQLRVGLCSCARVYLQNKYLVVYNVMYSIPILFLFCGLPVLLRLEHIGRI